MTFQHSAECWNVIIAPHTRKLRCRPDCVEFQTIRTSQIKRPVTPHCAKVIVNILVVGHGKAVDQAAVADVKNLNGFLIGQINFVV